MDEITFDSCKNNEPLVVRKSKIIQNWPCFHWKDKDWLSNFGSSQLTFRLHLNQFGDIPWENKSSGRIVSTLGHFLDWRRKRINDLPSDNPFTQFDSNLFWSYSSYNHLAKLPIDGLIKSINWSSIGFGSNLGVNGDSSTFWIGSKGAATPCHYDTYGYNLVAQIAGRKLWILFPPKDSDNLYPTRIPYEESSVFSEVNIESADCDLHPKFRDTCPLMVTLDPGDVLYVPYHWWHYVKCIDDQPDDLCISINQWLPMSGSNCDSLTEGLTSLLVATLFPFYQPPTEDWLVDSNAEETLTHPSDIIDLVGQLATSISNESDNFIEKVDRWIDIVPNECEKLTPVNCQKLNEYFTSPSLPIDIDGNGKWKGKTSKRKDLNKKISRANIINSILKPEVIQLIAKNLLE